MTLYLWSMGRGTSETLQENKGFDGVFGVRRGLNPTDQRQRHREKSLAQIEEMFRSDGVRATSDAIRDLSHLLSGDDQVVANTLRTAIDTNLRKVGDAGIALHLASAPAWLTLDARHALVGVAADCLRDEQKPISERLTYALSFMKTIFERGQNGALLFQPTCYQELVDAITATFQEANEELGEDWHEPLASFMETPKAGNPLFAPWSLVIADSQSPT